jgi:biopolymer transport protein ExbD
MKLFCNIDASALAAVIFVLAIVMMINPVTSSHHVYGPDLPRVWHAVSMSGANREDAMIISVLRDGAVYFGSDKVSPSQLPANILDRMKDQTLEPKIYIRADRRVWYGTVKEVLDGVRCAGIEQIAFLVDQRRSSSTRPPGPPLGSPKP